MTNHQRTALTSDLKRSEERLSLLRRDHEAAFNAHADIKAACDKHSEYIGHATVWVHVKTALLWLQESEQYQATLVRREELGIAMTKQALAESEDERA